MIMGVHGTVSPATVQQQVVTWIVCSLHTRMGVRGGSTHVYMPQKPVTCPACSTRMNMGARSTRRHARKLSNTAAMSAVDFI
jgi:hypothetical protein